MCHTVFNRTYSLVKVFQISAKRCFGGRLTPAIRNKQGPHPSWFYHCFTAHWGRDHFVVVQSPVSHFVNVAETYWLNSSFLLPPFPFSLIPSCSKTGGLPSACRPFEQFHKSRGDASRPGAAFAAWLIQYSKPVLHHGKFNLSIPCSLQVKHGVGASLEFYSRDIFPLTFSHKGRKNLA